MPQFDRFRRCRYLGYQHDQPLALRDRRARRVRGADASVCRHRPARSRPRCGDAEHVEHRRHAMPRHAGAMATMSPSRNPLRLLALPRGWLRFGSITGRWVHFECLHLFGHVTVSPRSHTAPHRALREIASNVSSHHVIELRAWHPSAKRLPRVTRYARCRKQTDRYDQSVV